MFGLCNVWNCIVEACFCHGLGYSQHFLLLCIGPHMVPGELQPVLFSPGQVLFVLLPMCHLWVLRICSLLRTVLRTVLLLVFISPSAPSSSELLSSSESDSSSHSCDFGSISTKVFHSSIL